MGEPNPAPRAWPVALALSGCVVAAAVHLSLLGRWVVEDAAISYAYARNLAQGLGLVPWPGAERVEGYSNPAWVALLGLGELLGWSSFPTSKVSSYLLTGSTVVLVHRLAERLVPPGAWLAPLAAAFAFAANTQVGIFGAAGLENPLFSALLAWGLVWTVDDARAGGRLRSAPVWLVLAWTRPEGVAYAGVAWVWSAVVGLRAGAGWWGSARWLAAFAIPFAAYHAVRFAYFAQELPATALAKAPAGTRHLLDWGSPAWTYMRDYAVDGGQGWFLPLVAWGAAGARGWRGVAVGALALCGAGLYLSPGLGAGADPVRLGFVPLALAVVGAAAVGGEEGQPERGLVWAMWLVAAAFMAWAGLDWVEGTRWMAMAAVPGSVLLGCGLAAVVERAAPASPVLPPLLAAGVLGAFARYQVAHTQRFAASKDLSPFAVHGRVRTADALAARMRLERRPRLITVDMGGFLVWSTMELVDLVGLVDLPMAIHRHKPWENEFFREYLGRERPPDLAWLPAEMYRGLRPIVRSGDGWVTISGSWRARRDLLFDDLHGGDPARRVEWDRLTLLDWRLPEPAVFSPGGTLALDGWVTTRYPEVVRLVAFLAEPGADHAVAWWPLTFLVDSDTWEGAVYAGRWTLELPASLPPGRYTLGLAARAVDRPLRASVLPPGATAPAALDALLLEGEVHLPGTVEVVDAGELGALAERELSAAAGAAAEGRCEEAERRWWDLVWRGMGDEWAAERRPALSRSLAGCWVARARLEPDAEVDHLERARQAYPALPELEPLIRSAVEVRFARAAGSWEDGDLDAAFADYLDILRLDPSRSWARRYAEQLRALRLRAELE